MNKKITIIVALLIFSSFFLTPNAQAAIYHYFCSGAPEGCVDIPETTAPTAPEVCRFGIIDGPYTGKCPAGGQFHCSDLPTSMGGCRNVTSDKVDCKIFGASYTTPDPGPCPVSGSQPSTPTNEAAENYYCQCGGECKKFSKSTQSSPAPVFSETNAGVCPSGCEAGPWTGGCQQIYYCLCGDDCSKGNENFTCPSSKSIKGQDFVCKIVMQCPAKADADTIGNLKNQAASNLNPAKFGEPASFLGKMVNFFSAAMGSIALVLYIWAGLMWMTASGNAERAGKAKSVLIWTTLGVLVILASYTLTKFVFQSLELIK